MIDEAITNKTENRLRTLTQKIPNAVTGLKGPLFVHVDFDRSGKLVGVSFSEKRKDDTTLEGILDALADAVTLIARDGMPPIPSKREDQL